MPAASPAAATAAGYNVRVSVTVANFDMTQPTTIGVVPGTGRIQYSLDPEKQPVKTTQTSDVNYTFTSVPAGEHTVRAELVDNNYNPLTPPVFAEVVIIVPNGSGASTATP